MAKKIEKPEPRFKKGDQVKISDRCVALAGCYSAGQTSNVRRVFWENAGGGQKEGWVCEVDIPFHPETVEQGFRCFWERLLDPA